MTWLDVLPKSNTLWFKGGALQADGVGADLKVTTAEMVHTMYDLAYRFDANGKSIVVSGDTSYNYRLVRLATGADILVMASLREGLCYALLEAMATGLPVAVHDMPILQWVVGGRGQLHDMRQAGAMRNAVQQLMAQPRLRARYGRKNREVAVSRFSWDVLTPRYVEMYRRCLAARKSPIRSASDHE